MSCAKTPYQSKELAVEALHQIQNKKCDHKIPVRTYQCDRCKKWHLTSKEIITNNAKPVRLKLADQWSALVKRQENREELFEENMFEKRFEKALSTITHNIGIQCEVLDQKFKWRENKLRQNFNREYRSIKQRLNRIKDEYNIPDIKIKPVKDNTKMDQWVAQFVQSKREMTIQEAEMLIAHYIN